MENPVGLILESPFNNMKDEISEFPLAKVSCLDIFVDVVLGEDFFNRNLTIKYGKSPKHYINLKIDKTKKCCVVKMILPALIPILFLDFQVPTVVPLHRRGSHGRKFSV